MDSTNHFRVVIIGAGPAGIGAAIALSKHGIKSIALIERSDKIGGVPSLYKKKKGGVRTFIRWSRGGIPVFGEEYANSLKRKLVKTDVKVWLQTQVIEIETKERKLSIINPIEGKISLTADAVIMACGSREKTMSERGWLTGARPIRVFFTKQLLQLIDGNDLLPMRNPVIIGSDLIGYAAAAKLKVAGAADAIIMDKCRRPKCSYVERLYFRRWSQPNFRGVDVKAVEVVGSKTASGIRLSKDGDFIPCDGIVVCGELVPNSELALLGQLKVELPSRKPVVGRNYQMSESGWFSAGNMLGGFCGAEWCYYNGRRVARAVVNYLSQPL
jgi:alkyl hydroperoxide reductase subunit AhpF